MGQLKRLPRAGWQFAGIPNPESVAEHSFRAAIVGIALATLVLLHDSPESRIGGVPAVGRAYVTTAAPEAVSVHQTAGMPDELANVFHELVRAYEAEESIEARLAHDADKLETLRQAREYEAQRGHDTVQWQESSTASLRTDAAKQLADAILATTPTTWWSAFARSYTELRKHTRGTRDTRPRPPQAHERG